MRNRLLWAALPLLAGCAATLPQYDDGISLLVGSERESTALPSSTAPREGVMPSGVGSFGTVPVSTFFASPVFPQDEDYSPTGLFMDNHGDFILQQERYEPMARFDVLWMPDASLKGEPGSFDLVFPTADVQVPLAVDPDTFVTVGGYFGARDYDTSSSFVAPRRENLPRRRRRDHPREAHRPRGRRNSPPPGCTGRHRPRARRPVPHRRGSNGCR